MKFFATRLFLFLSLIVLIIAPIVEAKTCKKYGPNGQVIIYSCSEPEVVYRPQWKTRITREGSRVVRTEIVADSVCYNYPEGSIEYRRCRRQAKDYFKKKCKELKRRYRTTKRPYNQEVKIDMDSFCRAERAI